MVRRGGVLSRLTMGLLVVLSLSSTASGTVDYVHPLLSQYAQSELPATCKTPAGEPDYVKLNTEFNSLVALIRMNAQRYTLVHCPRLGSGWTGNYANDPCKCHSVAATLQFWTSNNLTQVRARLQCLDYGALNLSNIPNLWEHVALAILKRRASPVTGTRQGMDNVLAILDPWREGVEFSIGAPTSNYLRKSYTHQNSGYVVTGGAALPANPAMQLTARVSYSVAISGSPYSRVVTRPWHANDMSRIQELASSCREVMSETSRQCQSWKAMRPGNCSYTPTCESAPVAPPVIPAISNKVVCFLRVPDCEYLQRPDTWDSCVSHLYLYYTPRHLPTYASPSLVYERSELPSDATIIADILSGAHRAYPWSPSPLRYCQDVCRVKSGRALALTEVRLRPEAEVSVNLSPYNRNSVAAVGALIETYPGPWMNVWCYAGTTNATGIRAPAHAE